MMRCGYQSRTVYLPDRAFFINKKLFKNDYHSKRKNIELAFVIYDLENLMQPELYSVEALSFPLRWAGWWPAKKIDFYFEKFKMNKLDLDLMFSKKVSNKTLNEMRETILAMNYFKARKRFIDQIFDAYIREEWALSINLAYPLIEGGLWSLADFVDKQGIKIFKNSSDNNYWTDFDPIKRILLTRKGKEIKKPTVGDLLIQTEMGDKIFTPMVDFFCNELYSERNPILHGCNFNYDNIARATKLLVFLREISSIMKRIQVDSIVKNINSEL